MINSSFIGKMRVVLALVLALAGSAATRHVAKSDHWGANLTTPELIEFFGYPVEVHHTTSAGYILELHRVPHGKEGGGGDRPVVLLHHGLLQSSSDWVMNTVDEALAYILADAGYDVWMANARGNTYSRHHETLDPDTDKDFWNFNWDQIGDIDVPATIDYILGVTGHEALSYVGYSMGTTSFWVMMHQHPEYNAKIRVMAALAPVAYLGNAKGLLKELAPYSNDVDFIMSLFTTGEFLPSSDLLDQWVGQYCDVTASSAEVCYNFLFLLCGADPEELNKEYLPVILAHTPAGASVHTLNHYAQLILSDTFAKYDYGTLGNYNHYGQAHPPHYDLAAVTAPVGLFWSQNDYLGNPQDVARLAQELPNVALNHEVSLQTFNHLDFTWAMHANEYVYQHLLTFLKDYN